MHMMFLYLISAAISIMVMHIMLAILVVCVAVVLGCLLFVVC